MVRPLIALPLVALVAWGAAGARASAEPAMRASPRDLAVLQRADRDLRERIGQLELDALVARVDRPAAARAARADAPAALREISVYSF